MTTDQKIKLRDYWYSLQDLCGSSLPESKRVELEHLAREIEEAAVAQEREWIVDIIKQVNFYDWDINTQRMIRDRIFVLLSTNTK